MYHGKAAPVLQILFRAIDDAMWKLRDVMIQVMVNLKKERHCACVVVQLHITAQSGPVILVIYATRIGPLKRDP